MNAELELLNDTENDLEWFKYNYENLKKKFCDRFIAIKKREVIDVDEDLKILIKKLKDKGEDPAKIFIKFISKIPVIL